MIQLNLSYTQQQTIFLMKFGSLNQNLNLSVYVVISDYQ